MKRLSVLLLLLCSVGLLHAASLPQEHAYQRTLRAYLATLTEADFAVEVRPFTVAPGEKTEEELYKFRILTDYLPTFGPGLRQPAGQFTLASIETPEGILFPPINIDALAWLVRWNYPGNPYYQSRPLKLRAFVTAAVDMMMLDHDHEVNQLGVRSDYLGGTLLWLAAAHGAAADAVPAEARAAYEAGLIKFVKRLDTWGPTGQMTDMDLFAAVSMRNVADQVNDQATSAIATRYIARLFTDDHYYHRAGYFVDNGCFDTSYNGISLFFGTLAALQAPDWPYIREAIDRAYKLKSYLTIPDPDGNCYGPSQCSSRTSGDPPHDQWNFPPRNLGAAMFSDHALFLTTLPKAAELKSAEARLINTMNGSTGPNHRAAATNVWQERHWGARPNYAYDFYVPGYYAKRAKLEAEGSPWLKNPYQRGENFIQQFEKAFLIAKYDDYACVLHTGPVGTKMYGWGGGELCAFWTPKTGSVLLGRRRGWERQTHLGPNADSYVLWREWPVHAVTGLTTRDTLFSSSRIRNPAPVYTVRGQTAVAKVSGIIPTDPTNNSALACLIGAVHYTRAFTADADGLTIETTVGSDGTDQVTELYETIPVYLRDGNQAKQTATSIQFRVGKIWQDATADPRKGVTAVKLTRFTGTVFITFAKPQRVKLSPGVWRDYYQSRAECRAILVDLLHNDGQAVKIPTAKVRYRFTVRE